MLGSLKSKAAKTAKRAGLLTGGLLAMTVGAAFLTVAAWIYLAAVTDTLTAALVIGGAYSGIGLLLAGMASTGSSQDTEAEAAHHAAQQSHTAGEQPPLVQAFLVGMQAGANATASRR